MTQHDQRSTEIRAFWTSAATSDTDAQGLRPTARDPNLQLAVEDAMEPRLSRADRVLDIGCGDGLSSLRFARTAASVVGVDYIAGFIERAKTLAGEAKLANASFETGDVMALGPVREKHGLFDVAVTIRCLINLSTHDDQAKAIGEIARCVRPGGLYLASEGWQEGMDGLNLMRTRAGLKPIEVAKYNLLLTRADFEREAGRYFELVDYIGLGFFLMMSRVAQPLFTAPDPPSHTHKLNEVALAMERMCLVGRQFDFCDYAGIYVLRRKA